MIDEYEQHTLDKLSIDDEYIEPVESEVEPFDGLTQVPVSGKFKCSEHEDAKNFVYVYATRTYHHVHKNGGLCSKPVLFRGQRI